MAKHNLYRKLPEDIIINSSDLNKTDYLTK